MNYVISTVPGGGKNPFSSLIDANKKTRFHFIFVSLESIIVSYSLQIFILYDKMSSKLILNANVIKLNIKKIKLKV